MSGAYTCKFCEGLRVPGHPIILERYTSERVIHYITQYDCGTTLDFILDGNQYKNFVWNRNCKPEVLRESKFRVDA
jgi:hypothetical protein